ncbi:hypothetical protein T440DRAFT_501192 [Plenodomus tracheiphilus IPT5]|uniref:Uncharacterized protein n=1 Tax=Plenodomus tracheiphilus IPT5 TaxID=1408161 RepID=A0A6A7AZ21_9PLEO|nr:hypothetical protein T440DRAFT_501192 [Plenodomus tracheiphilus IPT5]
MQPSMSLLTTVLLAIGTTSATITVSPGCPSAAPADVIVTRSAVVVPSCAGNETKPTLISMSGAGTGSNLSATATGTGGAAMFTGAAGRVDAAGAMAVMVGGAVVAMFV